MTYEERLSLDEIKAPGRDEKLHPVSEEDEEKFEQFKKDVGTEPDDNPSVWLVDGDYQLIDGDRRLRALTENGADDVKVTVYEEDELDQHKFSAKRIKANEHRSPSDPEARAFEAARNVAPWLIEPQQRRIPVDQAVSQSEFAGMVTMTQGAISQWLEPLRRNGAGSPTLRAVLATKASGNRPSTDDVEKIDRVSELLMTGGSDGNLIVPENQEGYVASEIADAQDVTLSELETLSETGVEENWSMGSFLEEVNDLAFDDEDYRTEIDEGMVDGEEETPVDDSTPTPLDEKEEEDDTTEVTVEESEDESPFGDNDVSVDWHDYVSDDDLPDGLTVDALSDRDMITERIKGDAAVAINVMSSRYNMTNTEVIKQFFGPEMVDAAVNHFEQEQQQLAEPADD